ncbi:pilus assembly protein PilG [Myxococcus sp. K15C18031901]|uniref:pilus assembly protein PilG n=1 Tax=Myxococcus dinghuensis TaxID=2906761 RepID=UPI0020A72DED|nr:pilus assembly protein PilG [Myxococcus dinghuensis]MCP3105089.1 pilus assembly protein PilG [Myxococcus dinghuensis]
MSKLARVLLPSGIALVALLSAAPAPPLQVGDRPVLPRPGVLRALFKAQLELVADYFWVLTINKVGSAKNPREYRDVYYYADLTTDLDPRFAKVYTFAGITIPIHLGRERYANVEESTQLLRKGASHLPKDTSIRFQLAYNLMFYEHQYREAGVIIDELAQDRDAPEWYSALATRLFAQAGDFETSMALAVTLRDGAEDEETREYYAHRVQEILQEQVLRGVDAAVERYRAREGRLPDTLDPVVKAGDLSGLPTDPLGGQLFLGEDGRSYSTAARFRLEIIYDEKTHDGQRVLPKPRATTSHDPASEP